MCDKQCLAWCNLHLKHLHHVYPQESGNVIASNGILGQQTCLAVTLGNDAFFMTNIQVTLIGHSDFNTVHGSTSANASLLQ